MRNKQTSNLRYVQQWQGCLGAWSPCLGSSGSVLLDSSGYRKNGSLPTAMAPASAWVVSGGKYALQFDGVDDYATLGAVADSVFSGTNATFGLSFWLRPSATMTDNAVIQRNEASGNQRQWLVRIFTGSVLEFRWFGIGTGASLRGMLGSTSITDQSRWYHCVINYDGKQAVDSRVSMFVSGVADTVTVGTSTGSPTAMPTSTASIGLGANNIGSTPVIFYNGLMDDVRIYNHVITGSDARILNLRRDVCYDTSRNRSYKTAAVAGNRRRRLLIGS